MKDSELIKKQNEFAKTSFGKRAKVFSICPFLFAACLLVLCGLNLNNENTLIPVLYFLGFCISTIVGCITQLQYGKMLNDYIKENNK